MMDAVELPGEIDAVLGRERDRLAAPGTWSIGADLGVPLPARFLGAL